MRAAIWRLVLNQFASHWNFIEGRQLLYKHLSILRDAATVLPRSGRYFTWTIGKAETLELLEVYKGVSLCEDDTGESRRRKYHAFWPAVFQDDGLLLADS